MSTQSAELSSSWKEVLEPMEAMLRATLEQAREAEESLSTPEVSDSIATQVASILAKLEERAELMEQQAQRAEERAENLRARLSEVQERLQKWQQSASRANALATTSPEEETSSEA